MIFAYADKLCGNHVVTDEPLHFGYIDSTSPLLHKSKIPGL